MLAISEAYEETINTATQTQDAMMATTEVFEYALDLETQLATVSEESNTKNTDAMMGTAEVFEYALALESQIDILKEEIKSLKGAEN